MSSQKVGFVSLGCPKATVDSEHILTRLRAEGYDMAASYGEADLVVINTCGFIDDAVAESLDTIGEALQENGKVIVTGCLGAQEGVVETEFPNVLAVTGPHAADEVMQAIHTHLPKPHDPFSDLVPAQGIRLTPQHYAYLKISEGCNHHCTFCIIPSMRGKLVSRPIEDVMDEAQRLVAAGVREILVIAQDTSAYGVDVKYRQGFWNGLPLKTHVTELARALAQLGVWVRLHYVYPYPHVDGLVELMGDGGLLPYLDVPLQHASPSVLKAMRRPANAENALVRIRRWREICPEITLRSTFIVGFPGETEQDFNTLLEFIDEAQLDRVGCFMYSPVDGATANALDGHVPEAVKAERLEAFMLRQQAISQQRLAAKVGKRMRVLVDDHEDAHAIARSSADAPEIDGVVVVENASHLPVGEFAEVEITASDEYDLYATVLDERR